MFCPKCGAGNPDGAKFCSGCGAPMPQAAGAGRQGQVAPAGQAASINQVAGAKPRRPKKKPIIIALVVALVAVAVAVGVKLFLPSGDPVSTMYLDWDTASFGYSVNGDDASAVIAGTSLTGKVQSTRQSGDVTIYEVGQVSFSGQQMPGDSKLLICAPKGATTGNPAGQWGVTVLGDYNPRQILQMKMTVDKNGACSYSFAGGYGLSSDDFDAFAADPLKDPSCLDEDNSDVLTASGTWSKADTEGQFSVAMNSLSDGYTDNMTPTLNLSAQYFDDLSQQFDN